MSETLSAPVPEGIFDRSILVVCDDHNRLGFYRDMLAERGYHVIGEEDPARTGPHLARDNRIAVVFLDIGAGAGALLDNLRASLGEGVEYIVAAEPGAEPPAAAVAERLVKPFSRGQLLTAVSSAYNLARMQRFRQEEMRELERSLLEFKSRTLAAMTHFMARAGITRSTAVLDAAPQNSLQALAEEECRRARLRGRIFGPLGLSHTSWLLLLVMAEAQWGGSELTVKSAAYSAGLPLSSALRKINEMCDKGLIVKRDDPQDARRSFVTLTQTGESFLARYLSELADEGGEARQAAN
jgi:DNA-binding MarR family transcriptional regulator/AmiR/NasT family two-component response regulator